VVRYSISNHWILSERFLQHYIDEMFSISEIRESHLEGMLVHTKFFEDESQN